MRMCVEKFLKSTNQKMLHGHPKSNCITKIPIAGQKLGRFKGWTRFSIGFASSKTFVINSPNDKNNAIATIRILI